MLFPIVRKQYAMYAGKKLLAIGTAKELAHKFSVQESTIRYMSNPSHKRVLQKSKKPTGKAKYVVKV